MLFGAAAILSGKMIEESVTLSVSGSAGLTRVTPLSFREIGTPGSLPGHPRVLSPGFCPLSSVTMTALGTPSPQTETALRGQDQWDWTHLEIVTTSSHWDHPGHTGDSRDTEGTLSWAHSDTRSDARGVVCRSWVRSQTLRAMLGV